jgi:hypothetical protein
MEAVRWFGIVGAGLALAGCGGTRQARTVGRLQSQVGVLEERVARLEQASVGWAAAAPSSAAAAPVEAIPVEAPVAAASAHSQRGSPWVAPSTRDIQQALKNAGFYQGALDGKRGPLTRQAILEFQRVNGLAVDGRVGPKTWSKLHAFLGAGEGEAAGGPVTALK